MARRVWDALHNSSRRVIARARAVCCVAFLANPASGTSFLEAVTILNVIAVSAATADADFKQFLDGMEVVDEGTAREFRSFAEIRILPFALDFL